MGSIEAGGYPTPMANGLALNQVPHKTITATIKTSFFIRNRVDVFNRIDEGQEGASL
jgi:hypothetical protein